MFKPCFISSLLLKKYALSLLFYRHARSIFFMLWSQIFHVAFYCFFYLKQSSDVSFKIGLSSSKKSCVICFIENLLKMMKNVFYFILKAHFVRKIYLFYQVFFSQVLFMTFWSGRKNSLIGKIRLTSKLMTSQPG